MKIIKNLFKISFVIIFLFLIGYVIGYIRYNHPPTIPGTVEHSPSLPQLKINGALIHIETYGQVDNPAIIAVHDGPGGDYRSMLNLKSLADSFFIVFYDQRGTGLSSRTDEFNNLSVDTAIADLHSIINNYCANNKVHLIGSGWGSLLSCEYAVRHPKKVDKLVLTDPPFLNDKQAEVFFTLTNGLRSPFNKSGIFHLLKGYFHSVHIKEPDKHASKDYFMYSLMHQFYKGFPLSGYLCNEVTETSPIPFWRGGALLAQTQINRLLDQQGQFNLPYRFKSDTIQQPVLLLTGLCNTITGKDFQSNHLQLFTNASIEEIDNSGHYLLTEQPEITVRKIRAFIK